MTIKRKKINNLYYVPERILNKIEQTLHSSLTLIEAPSGFGKTIAVKEYLSNKKDKNLKYLWYTCLGESAAAAWNGICAILEQADSLAARKLRLLGMPCDENLVQICKYIQEIRCSFDTVFVVDNFQLIRDQLPQLLLEAISNHKNYYLHFIIISQPSHKENLYVSHPSVMKYIGESIFMYEKDDVRQLFLHNGIRLTANENRDVYRMTEGWVAPLNMYSMEYKETGTLNRCEGINQLIETIIWKRLSKEQQSLLLYLSILESFSVEQVCIILNVVKLPQYAVNLIKNNTFLRYEHSVGAYVMHNLLKEYLIYRIERFADKEEKRAIYETAGRSCAEVKKYYQAARFFYYSKNYEELMKLPLKGADLIDYLGKGSDIFMMNVIENTSDEILNKYPGLIFVFAFELFLLGKAEQFAELCGIIKKILENSADLEFEERKLSGEFMLLMSFSKFNDIYEMSKMHRKAYEMLQGPSKLIVANHSWTFGAPSVIYMFWGEIGKLDGEMKLMDECIPYYSKLACGHGSGAGWAMRSEAFLLRGDDEASEPFCYRAVYAADKMRQDSIFMCAQLQLARIAILRGDTDALIKDMEQIDRKIDSASEQRVQYVRDLCVGFLAVIRGNPDDVPEWITEFRTVPLNLYEVATSFAHIIHLRYLWLSGGMKNRSEIYGLSEEYLLLADKLNFLLTKVYLYILLGIMKQSEGRFGDAQNYMRYALDIALPDRVYMPFAEMGNEIIPMLERAMLIQKYQSGVKDILKLLKRQERGVAAINKELYEDDYKLTPREREISILVQEGLNNAEIAEKLFISIYTVKNTLKKVFIKLNIKRRDELSKFKL
ncbi:MULTISPECIES: helix-turn-helix transcriptional regulator [unclassified Sedimentibacter]|uniref:helix-turn-helix transcriptional regulator n=1 Tax=unclassified Sedimentibacter TaxID=2649220 RepID=UPI0027E1EEB2|nr:LuxR C-terminal-related transcriptional regulator [Sedimentibacter sp. MB35-C1]WMJ78236.1 LuxR C-terminal-related transcriptional regulator [Sedimentibacter sp. MB35-C1]